MIGSQHDALWFVVFFVAYFLTLYWMGRLRDAYKSLAAALVTFVAAMLFTFGT